MAAPHITMLSRCFVFTHREKPSVARQQHRSCGRPIRGTCNEHPKSPQHPKFTHRGHRRHGGNTLKTLFLKGLTRSSLSSNVVVREAKHSQTLWPRPLRPTGLHGFTCCTADLSNNQHKPPTSRLRLDSGHTPCARPSIALGGGGGGGGGGC